jgi:hypothetical protein
VAETFREYVYRILSYVEGRDPRQILERTPAALARRIAGVSRRRLTARPRPGKWSAREILAHLSETELLWGCRMRLILGQNGVPLVGMDQDVWARRYRSVDPRRALATFIAIRRANLELLRHLRGEDLERWGVHSQFGRLTVPRILALIAGHDINHTRQIDAILAKRKTGRGRR